MERGECLSPSTATITPFYVFSIRPEVEYSRELSSMLSSSSTSSSSSSSSLDEYLLSIAPPRELICPITQEVLRDPVVAEDGHTYERRSLVTWYTMGRDRSPVTNALLMNTNVENLVPNLAVAGMANAHRERLGRELVRLVCHAMDGEYNNNNNLNNSDVDVYYTHLRAKVEGLLEAGADPDCRNDNEEDKEGGSNTPLHMLIRSGNIRLAMQLVDYDASVCLTNNAGLNCIVMAEEEFAKRRCIPFEGGLNNTRHIVRWGDASSTEWTDFIQELKRREALEKARAEARHVARSQANDEHRERQRTLASTYARSNAATNGNQRGLGRLEDGVGYFPSLVALQFQSSIPSPSPSVAEYENAEKERLNRILGSISCLVLIYFLLS